MNNVPIHLIRKVVLQCDGNSLPWVGYNNGKKMNYIIVTS